MTRLWWVRHGPTHARGMTGWTDLPADLSDRSALDRLAALLPPRAALVSSDLSRATATADALARGRRRLAHDRRLREIHFGAWEGRIWAEIDGPEARAFWEGRGRAPGGEDWAALSGRIGAAVADLAAAGHGDVVVVAHFGAILAALGLACGRPVTEVLAHRIEPLSLTEIAQGPGGWRIGRINHRA